MAIPADVGARNHQAFIETSTGVVARRSHISGGTLAVLSGTTSVNVTGGTLDSLNTVVGTVNIIAILGTVTNLQGGTIDKLASGTVNTVGMLQAGSLDILKAGTLDMLKAGTIDKLAGGTVDMLRAGTIDKVSSGTIDTIGTLSAISGTVAVDIVGGDISLGTLDLIKSGTLDMLKAGTVNIASSHIEAGGNILVRQTGGQAAASDSVSNTIGYIHNQSGVLTYSWSIGHIFNGTSWDRGRSIVDATDSTGIGIQAAGLVAQLDDTSPTAITENKFGNVRMSPVRSLHVEQPFSGTHIAAAGTSTISSAAGLLHLLTINTAGATGTITLTDGTAGGGGTIAIVSGNAQTTLGYNCRFTTGLSCIIAAGTAPDITISYR